MTTLMTGAARCAAPNASGSPLALDDVPDTAPGILAKLPVEVLAHLHAEAEHRAASAAMMLGALHSAMCQRYDTATLNDTGTHHRHDGGFRVTINVPKRVEWDQAKLASAIDHLRGAGEDIAEYVDTKLTVQERKYQAWPSALRDLFAPARTVKTGKPTFAFVADGVAERGAA